MSGKGNANRTRNLKRKRNTLKVNSTKKANTNSNSNANLNISKKAKEEVPAVAALPPTHIEVYRDPRHHTILAAAQKEWDTNKIKAICDEEGFYQHHGECANDAIQMFFVSADDIKYTVQNHLLHTNYDAYIPSIMSRIDAINKKYGYEIISETHLKVYMRAYQNRFARHYLNQSMLSNIPFTNKSKLFRSGGKNAIQSHLAIKAGNTKKMGKKVICNINEYTANYSGLRVKLYPSIFTLLATVFNLDIGVKLININEQDFIRVPFDKENTIGYIASFFYDSHRNVTGNKLWISNKLGAIESPAHAVCFYTCDGQDYFYEDNDGPVKCEWRLYFTIMNERLKRYKPTRLIFNHKRMYPMLELDDGESYLYSSKKTGKMILRDKYDILPLDPLWELDYITHIYKADTHRYNTLESGIKSPAAAVTLADISKYWSDEDATTSVAAGGK
jgi:hypothetical protein